MSLRDTSGGYWQRPWPSFYRPIGGENQSGRMMAEGVLMISANKKPGGNRADGKGGGPSRLQYTTKRPDGIPIYVSGKVIGAVKGDCFYKRVSASAHFLRKPPAIAFDVSSLRDAEAAGARWVEVTDAESGRIYRASMATIWERGKGFDREHGAQWFLTLDDWNRGQFPTQGRLF